MLSIKKFNDYLGIPVITLLLLSLLGVPRVMAHDLSMFTEGSLINSILVFAPIIIWIVYIVWKDVNKPFLSLLLIGIFYGIFLAIGHQILWSVSFDAPIQFGGNLSDLPQTTVNVIARLFAFFSSLITGTVVGVITGLVGSIVNFIKESIVLNR